jgi:hypothetical protein
MILWYVLYIPRVPFTAADAAVVGLTGAGPAAGVAAGGPDYSRFRQRVRARTRGRAARCRRLLTGCVPAEVAGAQGGVGVLERDSRCAGLLG